MNELTHTPGRQSGATMWGILAVMALVVAFALLTMKLVPAYIDNAKVSSALSSLAEDAESRALPRRLLIKKVSDSLYIDMADDLLDLNDPAVFQIQKTKNSRVVTIAYERVIPLVYNISALLDFEESVEIPLN
jgi:hypothetical protein